MAWASRGRKAALARNGTQTAFMGIWSSSFRPLLAQAIVGEASVQEVMDQGAKEWDRLRKQFR